VNEILGDFKGDYRYQTPVNQVIQEALTSSPLLMKVLASILRLWCALPIKDSTQLKVVDEQIGFEALKLVFMMARNMKDSQNKRYFLKLMQEGNSSLISSLQDKAI
jgi:hypothetical protein